jgi:hypothetical protein
MSRTVLFAGGPLHGKTRATDDHARTFVVPVPCGDPFGDPATRTETDLQFQQVAYSISKFVMCGRMILIGHLGTEPDEALVFEVLASDGAKAASVAAMPVRPV